MVLEPILVLKNPRQKIFNFYKHPKLDVDISYIISVISNICLCRHVHILIIIIIIIFITAEAPPLLSSE